MEKENDPDELLDLDIEPEQAIKAILDDDDAEEKTTRPRSQTSSLRP